MIHRSTMAALTLLATPAAALEGDKVFSETVLTFSRFGTPVGDVDSANFSLAGGWDMGPFTAGLEFDSSSVDGALSGDLRSFSVELDYPATTAVSLHLDAAYLEIAGEERRFTEIGATYSGGDWWLTAFAGQSDDGLLLAKSYHGVSGGYDFGQGTEATLAWYGTGEAGFEDLLALTVSHDSGALDASLGALVFQSRTAVLADVAYALSGRLELLGRFDLVDDDADRIATAQVGAAYEVSGGLRAFGLVGQRDANGAASESIAIGLRYDTGTQGLRDQGSYDRVVDAILYDRAGPLTF